MSSVSMFNDSVQEMIADELRNFKESVLNQIREDEDDMVPEFGTVFVSTEDMFEEFESIEEIYADRIVDGIHETLTECSLRVSKVSN